jgi:hypothetical protein
MGFIDKAKAAAETATTKAKEGIGDVQAKRELGQAYDELGKLTYELAESGELGHERIGELVERIRTLKGELEGAAAA